MLRVHCVLPLPDVFSEIFNQNRQAYTGDAFVTIFDIQYSIIFAFRLHTESRVVQMRVQFAVS